VSVPIGTLADTFGARRIAIAAATLVTAGTVLQGFAPSLPAFLVARAIFAIGWAGAWVSGPALLIEQAHALGGRAALGALELTAGIAYVVGPVLGALLFSIGDAAPFLVCGAASGVVLVGLTSVPEYARRRGDPTQSSHASWIRAAIRGPTVVTGVIALTCVGFSTGVMNLVVPVGLHADGADSAQIGLTFSVAAALYALGSAATIRFTATLATISAIAIGLVALAVTAAPAVCAVSALAIVLTLVFHTPVRGELLSAAFSLLASDDKSGSGAAVGLFNMSFGAASAVGPIVAGLLLRTGSVRPAFAAVSVMAGTGSVAVARIGQRARTRAKAAPSEGRAGL
jgi:MFS family permease